MFNRSTDVALAGNGWVYGALLFAMHYIPCYLTGAIDNNKTLNND